MVLVKWLGVLCDPMFASNNDARTNATPKTILLEHARLSISIEIRT